MGMTFLILNVCMVPIVAISANGVRDELGRTCLCILSRTGVEEHVSKNNLIIIHKRKFGIMS